MANETKSDVYVGIDVSEDSIDVHILPKGKKFSVNNNDEGHQKLAKHLSGKNKPRINNRAD